MIMEINTQSVANLQTVFILVLLFSLCNYSVHVLFIVSFDETAATHALHG